MLQWVWRVSEEVQKLANMDAQYRSLTQRRAALEPTFSELLSHLTDEDREFLLEYMEIADALQYRFSQLAWRYGTLHR